MVSSVFALSLHFLSYSFICLVSDSHRSLAFVVFCRSMYLSMQNSSRLVAWKTWCLLDLVLQRWANIFYLPDCQVLFMDLFHACLLLSLLLSQLRHNGAVSCIQLFPPSVPFCCGAFELRQPYHLSYHIRETAYVHSGIIVFVFICCLLLS